MTTEAEEKFLRRINELSRKERIWAAEDYVRLLIDNIERNETDYDVKCPAHVKKTIHRCLTDFKELNNVVRMVIDGEK